MAALVLMKPVLLPAPLLHLRRAPLLVLRRSPPPPPPPPPDPHHSTCAAQSEESVHGEAASNMPASVVKKPAPRPIRVRSVWAHNLEAEFALIRSCLGRYTIAAMDTEFPGFVNRCRRHSSLLSPAERYQLLKSNVDCMKLIQLGLTLSDAEGNLPTFGTEYGFVWEINFQFDVDRDLSSPDAIDLLTTSGLEFGKHRNQGVDPRRFAWLMAWSGLIGNGLAVTWVTFHGAYDFGYVIKALTHRLLPNSLEGFMTLVCCFFGAKKIYDIRCLMRSCRGIYGGLQNVANLLKVERAAGKSHQAGSDSLLTLQVFLRLLGMYFKKTDGARRRHAGLIFGLQVS